MSTAADPDLGGASGQQLPVVLVVEDDAAVREVLCENLLNENVRLVTAGDGAEAVAVYCRNSPKAVLLDLSMPGVDGFEFLRWLQKEPEQGRATAIVVTAHRDRDSVQRAMALGAAGYVLKPFDGADVRRRVRTIVEADAECAFI